MVLGDPPDPPSVTTVILSHSVSRPVAQPGDALLFTLAATNPDPARAQANVRITARLPREMRLRTDAIRIDSETVPGAVAIAPDGLSFTVTLGAIPAGQTPRITYAASVGADGGAGQVEGLAEVLGTATRANAVVRIERNTIAGRMTIIGRVVAGA